MDATDIKQTAEKFKSAIVCLKEPSLHFYLKAFGPEGPAFSERAGLRKDLVQKLETLKAPKNLLKNKQRLLTPGRRPPFSGISLSHCPLLGGFVFSFNEKISLGLDIELIERIKLRVINRVSTKEEVKEAPLHSFLWAAKEASFKCGPPRIGKKRFLKDCAISNWKKTDSSEVRRFSFQIRDSDIQGFGAAFEIKTPPAVCSVAVSYT